MTSSRAWYCKQCWYVTSKAKLRRSAIYELTWSCPTPLILKLKSTVFYCRYLVYLYSLPFHKLCADISGHLILEPLILTSCSILKLFSPVFRLCCQSPLLQMGVNLLSMQLEIVEPVSGDCILRVNNLLSAGRYFQ